ncbi:MAG TPA: ABC transporter permease [Anaerolineaceae bacterium]|nr:ABC transporter permease [Anaerolineaceae bacterium]
MKSLLWQQARHKKLVWLSLLVILVFAGVAALAPILAPHNPYRWNLSQSYLPPLWVQNTAQQGSPEFPLGTDYYGRDILSRLFWGTRTGFLLAVTAVSLTALIGTSMGLVSGYLGGKIEAGVTFLTELVQSVPGLMFMVMIVLVFRYSLEPTWFNGFLTLVVGYTAVGWASLARLVRVSVQQIRTQLYIEAAVSIGASKGRIVFRHILPNIRHVILVWIINAIPAVIMLEVLLGYIGIGMTRATEGDEFTVISWGGLFFDGRKMLTGNPLVVILPSVCILLISMSFILLADFLNDARLPDKTLR